MPAAVEESFGRRDSSALYSYLRMGDGFALVMAAVFSGALFLFRGEIGPGFGASKTVSEAVAESLPILLAGFIPLACARIGAARLYATAQSLRASVLTYAEFLFLFVLLLVLPAAGGLPMVWWSMSLSQIAAAVLAVKLTKEKAKDP